MTVFLCALFLAFVVAPLVRHFKPQLKGWLGEALVHFLLTRRLDQQVYRVIRNVMLPTSDGTTQIDHVVVSRYGIFVVETKNYKGWIFGTAAQAKWTQKIFKATHTFQNPLRQNYRHIKTLAELTEIPENYFKSVIVFVGEATFKTAMPPQVLHAGEVAAHIRSYGEHLIRDEQVPEAVSAIASWAASVSKDARGRHVTNLQRRHSPRPPPLPAALTATVPDCPKCGQPMRARTNRNDGSPFWGCSTYPRCNGILKTVDGSR